MGTKLPQVLRRSGVVAAAASLTLTAAAAAPMAAWAAGSHGGHGGSNAGHGHASTTENQPTRDSGGSAGTAAQKGTQPNPSHPSGASSHGSGASSHGSGVSSGSGASQSQSTRTQGPPGNNGTVKIHATAGDHSEANQPHVSCNFYVDFFGFDGGQTGTVTLTGQAPTGAGTQLFSNSETINPASARGQGNTWDSELAFTTVQGGSGNYVDVTSLGAPAHEGYHIRLSVDADGAPGGAKTKVFWVQPCGAVVGGTSQQAAGGTEQQGAGQPGSAQQVAGQQTTGQQTAGTGATVAGIGTSVLGEQFARLGSSAPALSAGTGDVARGAVGTAVLGDQFTRQSGGLPFTGADVAGLAVAGAAAIAGGIAAMVAFRRRRRPSEF